MKLAEGIASAIDLVPALVTGGEADELADKAVLPLVPIELAARQLEWWVYRQLRND